MKNFVDDCPHPNVKNFVDDTPPDKVVKQNNLVTNISVCVALKNRTVFEHNGKTYYPFKNFVKSLTHIDRHKFNIQLVVADFNSDDIKIESWIYDEIKHVELKIVKVDDEYFSRGRGLNVAVDNAKFDILFLTDADMVIGKKVIERGVLNVVKRGRTFFPIATKHIDDKMKVTRWFQTGTGNVMITRAMYDLMGRFNEYKTWGKEDKKFYDKMISLNKKVVREKCKGFHHQWHPIEKIWKNRYALPN